MTQSWPSQQALEGDQAQRILYNPKVCVCLFFLNEKGDSQILHISLKGSCWSVPLYILKNIIINLFYLVK